MTILHCLVCEIDYITLFVVACIRKKLAAVKGENSIDYINGYYSNSIYYINGSNKQRKEYY